jgi:integrase/recombinase XerD
VDQVATGLSAPQYVSKEAVPFTEDEIRLLLKACEYTASAKTNRRRSYVQIRPTGNRDRALILLLLDTGLRASECSRIQVNHVNLLTGEVDVIPFGSGRKTHSRQVYLGSTARRALWRYLAERETRERDPVFCTISGRSMNNHSIRRVVVNLGKRADVRNVYPHRFRHTFAIQYLRNGGDIFTLQRLLGHRSLEMVKRYLSIAQSDIELAHRQASPVDRWHL